MVSDDEVDGRSSKEGRKKREILISDDAVDYESQEEEQLRLAINLSLQQQGERTATGVRSRRKRAGRDKQNDSAGGLRTRRQARREQQERGRKRDEEEREERRQRETLLREQNREFEEGLIQDQVLEMQRRAEQERALAAEEQEKKLEYEKEKDRNRLYEELKCKFEHQQASSGDGRREIALMLRLPDGERLPRSFYADDLLEEVRQFTIMKLLEKDRYRSLTRYVQFSALTTGPGCRRILTLCL